MRYKREPLWATDLKQRLLIAPESLQVTITANGSLVMAEATRVTAHDYDSHVEPANRFLRFLFHLIRDTRLATWMTWPCIWQITLTDTFGAPVLSGQFRNRSEAVEFENAYMNDYSR